jgi:2-isopropylmalate synthase
MLSGVVRRVSGTGNGPIDAFVDAIRREAGLQVEVLDYFEHSIGKGAKANAIAYVRIAIDEYETFGVGRHESILTASFGAVLSGIQRARRRRGRVARASA